MTDWFPVLSGLKQGCLLSPLIFNIFVNDLTEALDSTGLGISMEGMTEKLNMLLYADDLALIADSEENLQKLIEVLYQWCEDNDMTINSDNTFATLRSSVQISSFRVEIKLLKSQTPTDIWDLLLTS